MKPPKGNKKGDDEQNRKSYARRAVPCRMACVGLCRLLANGGKDKGYDPSKV